MVSCYSIKWSAANFPTEHNTTLASPVNTAAPEAIKAIFKKHPKGIIIVPVLSPENSYKYDISEKDRFFDSPKKKLLFNKVTFQLVDEMPKGQVLTDEPELREAVDRA